MIHTLLSRRNLSMRSFVFDALSAMGPSAIFPITDELAPGFKAPARVDHGSWLVDCLFCTNAVLLDPEDPRTYCLNCFNAKADYRWVWVEMPEEAERDAIDAVLEDGRAQLLQCWMPGQTVEDLKSGAPVPTVMPTVEHVLAMSQAAFDMRDGLVAEVAALQDQVAQLNATLQAERAGALLLIRHLERTRGYLDQEREFNQVIAATQQSPHPHEHN